MTVGRSIGVLVAALLLLGALVLAGRSAHVPASSSLQDSEGQAVVVGARDLPPEAWAPVVAGPWRPLLGAYGKVADVREVRITAPFPVRIIESAIELGQQVDRGQLLATIEAPMVANLLERFGGARRRVALAREAVQEARTRRQEQLATNDDVIRAEVSLQTTLTQRDDAWQRLGQALISLGQDLPREDLERLLDGGSLASVAASLSVVRAPFAGVVMDRAALPGVTVGGGGELFAIEDVSSVYVDVGVQPEQVDEWLGGEATGKMLGADVGLAPTPTVPRLDPDTGLMLLRYRGVVPGQRQLDGAWIAVTLRGAEREAMWVPVPAVAARAGTTWCLISDARGQPHPVQVTVGPPEQGRIPVIEGLSPTDRVLTQDAYEMLYKDLNALISFKD